MALIAIAFLIGVMVVHQAPTLILHPALIGVAALAGGLAAYAPTRVLAALVFSVGWAWVNAACLLNERVAPNWEGQDVELVGVVSTLPIRADGRVRFQVDVESITADTAMLTAPRRVRLTWFDGSAALRAGERWRFTVRLKQPHGYANFGGFDFEGWLFANGVRAVGYVREGTTAARLAEPQGLPRRISALREELVEQIHRVVVNHDDAAILAALVTGDQHAVTPHQWDVMLTTGTNHLISISGLHVALIAGLVFAIVRRAIGWFAWTRRLGPASFAAAAAAGLAAVGYSALAGFAIPTQRSMIMIAIALYATVRRRTMPGAHGLAASLIAVLLWDPFAPLSASFWLSFGLVAVIFWLVLGRASSSGWWWRFGRLHVWLGLAAIPLVLNFFTQISWLAPLANVFAVPWVGLLVVPLALVGSALAVAGATGLGESVLQLAGWAWHAVEWALSALLSVPGSRWFTAIPPHAFTLCALLGIAIWSLPRATAARWLASVAVLPLLLWRPESPHAGEAWFTLLDVGQGLAAVVRTRDHVLVYDTGPRFSETFDAGSAVVVPFLRANGLDRIDTLMVGHGDNDHAGGVASVLRALPVARFLSGVPERFSRDGAANCQAGQHWEWDGVLFDVLHPSASEAANGNDLSCVLRIAAGVHRILLTGDIEAIAERQLLARVGDGLAADILVAPHHGSTTSSTAAFIDAVGPEVVLYPVGYRNRYGFPAASVRERYAARGIASYDSVAEGASEWRIGGARIQHFSFRAQNRHYWHWVEGG